MTETQISRKASTDLQELSNVALDIEFILRTQEYILEARGARFLLASDLKMNESGNIQKAFITRDITSITTCSRLTVKFQRKNFFASHDLAFDCFIKPMESNHNVIACTILGDPGAVKFWSGRRHVFGERDIFRRWLSPALDSRPKYRVTPLKISRRPDL